MLIDNCPLAIWKMMEKTLKNRCNLHWSIKRNNVMFVVFWFNLYLATRRNEEFFLYVCTCTDYIVIQWLDRCHSECEYKKFVLKRLFFALFFSFSSLNLSLWFFQWLIPMKNQNKFNFFLSIYFLPWCIYTHQTEWTITQKINSLNLNDTKNNAMFFSKTSYNFFFNFYFFSMRRQLKLVRLLKYRMKTNYTYTFKWICQL